MELIHFRSIPHTYPNFSLKLQNILPLRIGHSQLQNSFSCIRKDVNYGLRIHKSVFCSIRIYKSTFFCQAVQHLHRKRLMYSIRNAHFPKTLKYPRNPKSAIKCSEDSRNRPSAFFVRYLVGMILVVLLSVAVQRSPTFALTEENQLFLEAWRTVDRAYVDKSFNGQSWFRYREMALRNEPMNTREETYMAIRKMLATLDDPFTRFLEPEKFKSLRVHGGFFSPL